MDVRDRSTYTTNVETTAIQSPTRLKEAGAGTASASASSGLGSDSSQLSAASRTLAHTMQLPEVREDRIASLQQRIAAGNYQVSAHDVADAILGSVPDRGIPDGR
jgi:flagellar biosynthesis anti-sigma factor FlgM